MLTKFLRFYGLYIMSSKILLVAFLCIISIKSLAQDCDCDHLIEPKSNNLIDGEVLGVKPGDKVCLKSGLFSWLRLQNFKGTRENPLTIINCGGLVKIGPSSHHFRFVIENSEHFRLSGSGSSEYYYGIKIDGGGIVNNSSGLTISTFSTDFEVDHLEFSQSAGASLHSVLRPDCDPKRQRGGFTQRNLYIHDNYIHDSGTEGFYIGYSFYDGVQENCNGQNVTIYPISLENINIFRNIFENTGWDAFQVSCADGGANIYNNIVRNFATNNVGNQGAGIVIGGGTKANVFNNWIDTGFGGGINLFGLSEMKVYNNVILNAGKSGIFVGDKITSSATTHKIINNTIIKPKEKGIDMNNGSSKDNVFYNNIIVEPGALADFQSNPSRAYIYFNPGKLIKYDSSNNHFSSDIENMGFKDHLNKNYLLTDKSTAAFSGRVVSGYGITHDLNNFQRGNNGTYSKGAYEIGSISLVTGIENVEDIANSKVLDIFPNPIDGSFLTVKFSLLKESNISIDLIDVSGRILGIPLKNVFFDSGSHSVLVSTMDIDVKSLSILRFQADKEIKFFKIIR